jgi:histidyl-tRNA synthetase
VGFGLGVDRTCLAVQAEGLTLVSEAIAQVFIVPVDQESIRTVVALASTLRAAEINTDIAYDGRSMKAAMKSADRSGAKFAIILGEDELATGTVVVKDLVAGSQESVPVDSLIDHLKAQLKI